MTEKRVYLFREGAASQRDLLGGKGANLCEMTNIGLPVPPGFIITTDVCREYYSKGQQLPAQLMADVRAAMGEVERDLGKKFGDPSNPLLVSVRSGAKFSMPGMMDTILNLGLNEETLKGLISLSGNERFAWDSFRRFVMMFSDVVLGVSKHDFDKFLRDYRKEKGAALDTDLDAQQMKEVAQKFLAIVEERTGQPFPSDPWKQIELAIEAVFRSWNNERAIVYRRTEKIPDDIGTAVNIQAMVFGNLGEDSGTGVAFTRDPSTGENTLYGEYLMNAQGEDVVAGVRTPVPIAEMERQNPQIYKQFHEIGQRLEQHYNDMMDLEFTVEKGRLFMLQCRAGKRTGPAAVRIAVEMVSEGLLDKRAAIMKVSASHLDQLLHPRVDESSLSAKGINAIASGLPASPGAAVGAAVFDADTAEKRAASGEKVILVRDETNPDDVHGMLASQGVLTARGGKTSHAAVVARGFGIPCVAGCESIEVDDMRRQFSVHGVVVREGDLISIDGTSGNVYSQEVELIEPQVSGDFGKLMQWCDEARRLGVRANADNPRDAAQAIEFGAEGIGLCRTEHMFFERERLPVVQSMILAKSEEVRKEALSMLEVMQQKDFEGIFEVMDGKPVTIRLIDPPLHEFLPSHDELLVAITEMRVAAKHDHSESLRDAISKKEEMLTAVESMREQNPMLGLRGVRLSILFPGIVEMQTRAILNAAVSVKQKGIRPIPEIMIPLVGHVNELRTVREQLTKVAEQVVREAGEDIPYKFGTMIEIPRAALTAAEIAAQAEFFSFGTNDLTQTTFGFSRDDAEGKFLGKYVDDKILPRNPFETIDFDGVGRLMQMCVADGRAANPSLKLGICGEHGGDPESIAFCHDLGLDYVSCSPFRVPIARLSAAQANIRSSVAVVTDK